MTAKAAVTVTDELRSLIRVTRKEHARLTQRAAAREAGYSTVWWRHIESGQIPEALVDTLARMCFVVGVSPERLATIGFPEVAEGIQQRRAFLEEAEGSPYKDEAEAHLWRTPVSAGTRRALIAYFRKLQESGGDQTSADIINDLRS